MTRFYRQGGARAGEQVAPRTPDTAKDATSAGSAPVVNPFNMLARSMAKEAKGGGGAAAPAADAPPPKAGLSGMMAGMAGKWGLRGRAAAGTAAAPSAAAPGLRRTPSPTAAAAPAAARRASIVRGLHVPVLNEAPAAAPAAAPSSEPPPPPELTAERPPAGAAVAAPVATAGPAAAEHVPAAAEAGKSE